MTKTAVLRLGWRFGVAEMRAQYFRTPWMALWFIVGMGFMVALPSLEIGNLPEHPGAAILLTSARMTGFIALLMPPMVVKGEWASGGFQRFRMLPGGAAVWSLASLPWVVLVVALIVVGSLLAGLAASLAPGVVARVTMACVLAGLLVFLALFPLGIVAVRAGRSTMALAGVVAATALVVVGMVYIFNGEDTVVLLPVSPIAWVLTVSYPLLGDPTGVQSVLPAVPSTLLYGALTVLAWVLAGWSNRRLSRSLRLRDAQKARAR